MSKMLRLAMLVLFLTACGAAEDDAITASGTPELTPYHSPTPTLTITPLPPLPGIVIPTSTPVTYTVASGDTFSAIAGRFNISLLDMQAANPGIDPQAIPIGTVLIIPQGGVIAGEPSPTPAPVTVRQAHCFPETSGGLWCFALIENEHRTALESISARFTLLDAAGDTVASETTYAMLNILPAGASMALALHFPPPITAEVTPRVDLLTSILLLPDDTRYVPVTLDNILVQMTASGLTAAVTGEIRPDQPSAQVNTVWILATAYDAAGRVVGARRWESATMIAAGNSLPFEMNVFSLGPAIERVELLVEARP